MKYQEIINLLNLKPHPEEGGYFSETYRSDENISGRSLPERYNSGRSFGTCIYYLLTKDSISAMHKLNSDEIFHFYLGDPIEITLLYPDGSGGIHILGPDLSGGMRPQIIVPMGVWQGSRLIGGDFALLGTTVAPGFEYDDYENGKRDKLIKLYPEFMNNIIKLTK